jgi:ATP-dependent protease ClpP protease subunit
MIKVQARGPGQAEILIYDPIGGGFFGDGVTAKRFVDDLEGLGDVRDILVRINSPGGEVFDGFAIFNALKNHPAQVHVQIDGLAASIASVIAMSGDLITVGDGAMLMIHDPWSLAMGDADDMRAAADMLDKVKVGIAQAYVNRTGLDAAEIDAMMTAETWFTADEAVAQGFADERTRDTEPAIPPEPAARFNWAMAMAKYHNTPQSFNTPQASADLPKSAPAGAMPKEAIMTTQASASVQDADKIAQDAGKAALAQERARRTGIRNAFGRYSDEHRTLLDDCLDDENCSVQAAQTKLLAKLAEGAESIVPKPGTIVPGADGGEKFKAGAAQALLSRIGIEKREAANEFNGLSLCGIAAHALSMRGISVKGLSNDGIARKVLALSSSDFPSLMSNVAGKVLRAAYDAFPDTWRPWVAVGEVSDFKVHPRIQIGAFNALDTIPEGGEYTYGGLAEEAENAQATTKGKAIALTRQMVVNDDLGAFNRRAQLMGRAAARSVNASVYALLTSGSGNNGPDTSDTGQYFNATAVTTAGGHANLTSGGTAISTASLGVGRTAMRKQKDKSLSETLNIQPTLLLTPVGVEDLAKEIVTSETKSGQTNSRQPNVLRNMFTVISDPYLDGVSATAWYLFANPLDVAPFEVVFLDGNQTPFLDEMVDFDTDAMKFKVRLDYGVAIGDWRAGYKNAGA